MARPEDRDDDVPASLPRGNPLVQAAIYVALAAFGTFTILWLLANT